MKPLMVFCGWCGAFLKGGCLPASHGICPTCEANNFPSEVS